MRTCSAPDCLRPVRHGELCEAHAKRRQRDQPLSGPIAATNQTPRERFLEAVLRYAAADSDDEWERSEWVLMNSAIPEEFKDRNTNNKWLEFQRTWFFKGIKSSGLVPKPGIDMNEALRHLQAIQSSYEPKHEHKEACVAYLASLWFEESSTW